MYALLSICAICITFWDMYRRRVARDEKLTLKLADDVAKLVERQRLAEAAQLEFLRQIREAVNFSDAKKRELEMKLASRKL